MQPDAISRSRSSPQSVSYFRTIPKVSPAIRNRQHPTPSAQKALLMELPARTIVYIYYRREANLLTRTTGGLRDATPAECDHRVGHGWLEESDEGTLRLNLAIEGIQIRPPEVAMEQVAQHDEQWQQLAREALAQLLPECEVAEQ